MKKPIYFFVIMLVLFVSTTFVASAVSFEGDAGYYFGLKEPKSRGFVVHGRVELMDDILVDGSFLSTSSKDTESDKGSNRSLFGVGGLYRPVNDDDLQVFVGAGFHVLSAKETDAESTGGQGIYGKFGFRFLPMPDLILVADVSYAPRFKEKGEANTIGNLISARATVSYEVLDGLSVQGSIKHYKAASISDTLVGGGITFSF